MTIRLPSTPSPIGVKPTVVRLDPGDLTKLLGLGEAAAAFGERYPQPDLPGYYMVGQHPAPQTSA